MRKILSIALLIAGLLQWPNLELALADDAKSEELGDSRIKLLMYDESDVYTITTRYGYQTNIVFSPNEEIETISVGDRSVWQIIPAGNRLFIRPMDEDVTTNMTILTNKHSYQFDLKSIAADKSEGNIYVAKFVYNDEKKKPSVVLPPPAAVAPPAATAPAASESPKQAYITLPSPFGYAPSVPPYLPEEKLEDAAAPAHPDQSPLPTPQVSAAPAHPDQSPPQTPLVSAAPVSGHTNYNYTYSGPDEAAPLQVYDDGKSTYIKYRTQKQSLPTIFIVDSAGNEIPTTYTVKNDYMVVDVVVGEMALKSHDGTVHIFDENVSQDNTRSK